MKVLESAASHHLNNANYHYPTLLTADTSNSLPSPPSSFYEKNSHDVTPSFCDGTTYNNTTNNTPETTTQASQPLPLPQNYTIEHSSPYTSSSTAPTLSTFYDFKNGYNENMTIHHSQKENSQHQHQQQQQQQQQQEQQHYQPLSPTTALLLDYPDRYHQASGNRIELHDTTFTSEADPRSCHICGKIYKHSSCLYKHLWEHSVGWELTSKLPLTKHQQVQLLEAASILVGMSTKTHGATTTLSYPSSFVPSPSSSSSLTDIQSMYRPYDDGIFIDIDGVDQDSNDDDDDDDDDGSDIINIVDEDDSSSSSSY